MKNLSIVYFSGTGHTQQMAEAVADGARSVPGITVQLLRIEGKDIVEGRYRNEALIAQLDGSDAVLFGSPTYMGDVAGQMKCFLDAASTRWFSRAWVDKLAGGFTVSAGASGDKLHALQTFALFAAQCGMLWIGHNSMDFGPDGTNRLGSALGAMGQEAEGGVHPADRTAGQALGARAARCALRWGGA